MNFAKRQKQNSLNILMGKMSIHKVIVDSRLELAPVVSIIIPYFNREAFVVDAFNSVLESRRMHSVEIIIIDDGSHKSIDKKSFVGEDDVLILRYSQNRGANYARNIGIEMSRGKYILFLDSDDILLPGAIDEAIRILGENLDVGAVCGSLLLMRKAGDLTPSFSHRIYSIPRRFSQSVIASRNPLGPLSKIIFRADFVKQMFRFDEDMVACQDWEFYGRFTKKYAILTSPRPYIIYREHFASITANINNGIVARKHLFSMSNFSFFLGVLFISNSFLFYLSRAGILRSMKISFNIAGAGGLAKMAFVPFGCAYLYLTRRSEFIK